MRPGCVRIESAGSLWWIDENAKEYLRTPKVEAPRDPPEWGDERAGALQDLVWHPYDSWALIATVGLEDYLVLDAVGEWPDELSGPGRLHIFHDDTRCVVAPDAVVLSTP